MRAEFWRMGATPVPVAEIGRIARELEQSGWDGLSVGEAHAILPDPYAALAVAAVHTTRLKLGTAVAVPLRSPLLAASAMYSIQAISGGRAAFSVGRGDGAMKVMSREPLPVDRYVAYLRDLMGLLKGEEIQVDGAPVSMARMPVIDSSFTVARPSVDVAATGPRMIALAATTADGVSFAVGADLERLKRCISAAREARQRAGLDPDALMLGAYVQMAVTSPGDASAQDAVRGLVLTHSRFSGFEGKALADVDTADHDRISRAVEAMDRTLRTGHRTIAQARGARANEVDFYPANTIDDEFLQRFGIVGPPEVCAERLAAVVETGIHRVYIGTRAVGIDPAETNSMRIGREVLPLVRRHLGA